MRTLLFILLVVAYFGMDIYIYSGIKPLWQEMSSTWRRIFSIGYWTLSIVPMVGMLLYSQIDHESWRAIRSFVLSGFFMVLFGKVLASLFLLIDDFRRGVLWLAELFPGDQKFDKSRSEFLRKVTIGAAAVPIATMAFGIASGAHDYRVRKKVLSFPNLPKEFDGIRVLQVSDIHTGSFFNKTAVRGGVDMINDEKPDIFFFTGDLVNNQSEEAKDYLDIFKKVNAPLGRFSIMGNHDYGDYYDWGSDTAKQKDVQNLQDMHRYMGWDILLNENRKVAVDGQSLAILGVENWGAKRFRKYGDMAKTYNGAEKEPFKILLSHDPSHWDAQVRPEYPDIDLTLSGHTHGFQFGIEIGDFKWSPSQYIYKQWADHYQEGNQHIYVNRGFGYLGYPGRIGILPEITVLELKRG
jgi:predicted MPP superfamily phosphohydrolase